LLGLFSEPAPQPPLPTSRLAYETKLSPILKDQGNGYEDDLIEKFTQCLEASYSVEDIQHIVDTLGINLQEDAKYSSLAFNWLLLQYDRSNMKSVDHLVEFLLSRLNVPHAKNHQAALRFMAERNMPVSFRRKILWTIERNIQLGSLLTSEIGQVIQLVGYDNLIAEGAENEYNLRQLAAQYHAIWEAIQACDVLRLSDFQRDIILDWLDRIISLGPDENMLRLALEIILSAYQEGKRSPCSRIPGLIVQCLRLAVDPVQEPSNRVSTLSLDSIRDLLSSLDPNISARCMIQVTEYLAFTEDRDLDQYSLLSIWKDCLDNLMNSKELIMSTAWRSLEPLDRVASLRTGIVKASATYDHQLKRQRAVIRLWIISSLSRSFPLTDDFSIARGECHRAVTSLLRMFQSSEWEQVNSESVSCVLSSILEISLPHNDILTMVARITSPTSTRNRDVRHLIKDLESSNISLADVFADVKAFNSLKGLFFSAFSNMVNAIDITHPSFVQDCLRLAETGDHGSNDILRILKFHIPVKVAVSKAWPRSFEQDSGGKPSTQASTYTQSHQSQSSKAIYQYLKNSSSPIGRDPLEPQACVDILHLLAVSFGGSSKIHPRKAFRLVQWIFRFLYLHNAPIKPQLIRALYHSGVVRYRQVGLHIPPKRYNRIMQLARQYEDADILEEMKTIRVG
jgi:hypothetical protein